jgi:hypothetical protein
MKLINAFLWRAARTAAALALASTAAWVAKDPKWIWLTPIIAAVGKVLRDRYGLTNIPL